MNASSDQSLLFHILVLTHMACGKFLPLLFNNSFLIATSVQASKSNLASLCGMKIK